MSTIIRKCFISAVTVTILSLPSAASSSVLPSTFGSNTEGWTAADRDPSGSEAFIHNHATPTWVSAGGNPGGYIHTSEGAGDFYFRAPAMALPDISAAKDTFLCFDLISDLIVSPAGNGLDAVILTGNPGGIATEISYTIQPITTPNVWTHFTVPLGGNSWYTRGVPHAPVSSSTVDNVLMNLTNVDILAEFGNGQDTGGLDNVMTCVPEPTSVDLVCCGIVVLAGFQLLRARRARSDA
jgi:hypothetical protein